MFDLYLLEFVELVRGGKLLEALFVSRDKIHPLATSDRRINMLKVFPSSLLLTRSFIVHDPSDHRLKPSNRRCRQQ